MTLRQLKDLVAAWVDDKQFGYFTEPEVQGYLNHAQKEVQKLLVMAGENFYLDCKETPIVASQARYVLPEDFLKVNRLEFVTDLSGDNLSGAPLKSITLNQIDLLSVNMGSPTAYYLKKSSLILAPAPDSTPATLRLYYSYRVADMTADTQVPDVPEEYHEALAVWAAYDCILRDGRDPSALKIKMDLYTKMMNESADERTVDAPRMVVSTENESWGVY